MRPRKKRSGRRSLSKNYRTVLLGVAVTTAMKAAVDAAADEKGMSTSNFIRILIKRHFDAENVKAAPAAKPQAINPRHENNWWPISRPAAGGARSPAA